MFCCFNLPLATSTFWHGSWLHGPLLCRLFPLLRYGLVAVSLFTVLAITINRYIMIGHPRLYPKLYKPKYLVLMVLATWLGGFGALIPTWFEQWGRFGLDPAIGSCSILPDVNSRSPKEFLFILAFLAPCIAIVVCYARIFYIVRRTALKSRRRDEATKELVRSNFQTKLSKNQEDSAIGSMSCQATHTSENSGSPIKYEHQDLVLGVPDTRVIPEVRVQDNQPLELPRSLERMPANGVSEQILDTGTLQKGTSRFLTPPIRYEEVSDDCASSRSDSPSEKRRTSDGRRSEATSASGGRVLGRGSRFRSVRGRNFETGKMTAKDKKLLKMILVIFSSFLVCYLPITITKTFKEVIDWRGLNIAGYILIYLTTCINPVIYVVMSSEYRSAYKNVLLCRSDSGNAAGNERRKLQHKKQRPSRKIQRNG
ncbi:PREDICTED: G-protein coupled receptor moody [Ceratosolen solmsi marchali]|uniref:G-protein coupled receptor moody n=1 Tax=Ceratosolen solmsi marchali TaxID=326594 RepID=A0AAJ6YJD6_9HYME|nr:PREDICTED: G-protein coupled receptor moody [Ceratosolen solmsi marchali]